MALEVEGTKLAVDFEGYLVDPAQWNEQVAEELARQERIVLTDEHWAVIRFMREYYEQHHIAPDARHVMKHLAELKGAGQGGTQRPVRALPLRLRQAGLQDRRHAQAAGLEHRLKT